MSRPQSPLQEHYANLEKLEREYCDNYCNILQQNTFGFNFLGFIFRGLVLEGSRRQTVGFSKAGLEALGVHADDVVARDEAFENLAELYLQYYGKSTSINNLVLEREEHLRDVDPVGAVLIHYDSDVWPSRIEKSNERGTPLRLIRISSQLTEKLGFAYRGWDDVYKELRSLRKVGFAGALPLLFERLSKIEVTVNTAVEYALLQESGFCLQLAEYGLGKSSSVLIDELLPVARVWLRAFHGLVLFARLFGKYWATAPAFPEYAKYFTGIHMRAPLCAFTGLASTPEVLHELGSAVQSIQNSCHKTQNYRRVCNGVDAAVRGLWDSRGDQREELRKVFPDWSKVKPPLLETRAETSDGNTLKFVDVPHISRFLSLSLQLVGAKHEQMPLGFILLCAPESAIVRRYYNTRMPPAAIRQVANANNMRQSWSMRVTDPLKKQDFPAAKGSNQYDAVLSSVKANALILQECGRALLFRPFADDFMPQSIVEFVPFDPRLCDAFLETFTDSNPGSLAVSVRHRDAVLFAFGRKVAFGDGRAFRAHVGLGGYEGVSPLVAILAKYTWLSQHADNARVMGLVEMICQAAICVAERRLGALFFFRHGEFNERTPLAPVWGGARSLKTMDDVEALAAVAGLDGETFVNLDTGIIEGRQFLQVPWGERFLHIFKAGEGEDGRLGLCRDLQERWEQWERNMDAYWDGARERPIEDIKEVYDFGTRHQKAMRMTWAYEDLVAITVSQSGPIRAWYKGIPIAKFGQ